MMLTAPPGVPGYHLTEALSKWHPKGASVASLRPFTVDRNGRSYLIGLSVHFRRNTHQTLSPASLQAVSEPVPESGAGITGSGMARTMRNPVVHCSRLSPCRCLRFAKLP